MAFLKFTTSVALAALGAEIFAAKPPLNLAAAFAPTINSRFLSAPLLGTIQPSTFSKIQRSIAPEILPPTPKLFSRIDNDEDNNQTEEYEDPKESQPALSNELKSQSSSETSNTTPILQRFLNPRIDDPGLPITDALLAQIVAPSLQIYWLLVSQAPSPSWLQPISNSLFQTRGALLAPTLIHGAGLAVCWLAGALAGRMYEGETFLLKEESKQDENTDLWRTISRYDTLLSRLVQAGAFATGILIVSTQLDLMLEFKRYVQVGESEETDLRLLVAIVEVINDVFFEALVLGSWRIIHCNFMSNAENRWRRF